MAYRNGNYAAFYVKEPFNSNALGAHATEDFRYYNLLRLWAGADDGFPFNDSHNKTYNVRDGSDWETTLKPRLRERLRNSKNLILFLSSVTINSRALREEIEYGIKDQGLPVIVVYPDYESKEHLHPGGSLTNAVQGLWGNVPAFRDLRSLVPTVHVPLKKEVIKSALKDADFCVGTKKAAGVYIYR
jgi:hypothetical protein